MNRHHHHRNLYGGAGNGSNDKNVVVVVKPAVSNHMNSINMITDESLSSKTSTSSSTSSISISSTTTTTSTSSTSLSTSDNDDTNNNQNQNENDTEQTRMIQRLNEQLRVSQCKLLHANSYIKSLQIIQDNCISLEEYHSVLHEIELLKQQQQQQQQQQQVVHVVEVNEENVEQQQATNNDELMIANDTILKLEQEIQILKQQQAKNIKKKSKSIRSTTSSVNGVDTNMNHHNHHNNNNISQDLFDAENTIYTLTQEIDQLRIELTSLRNKENNKDTNQNDRNTCINCKCTTSSQQQHPQQQQHQQQKTTTQPVELELQFLRKDRIQLQHQINQLRILLWNVEEQSHIHRLKLQSIKTKIHNNNINMNHMTTTTTTTNELQQHQHRQKDNEQLHECIAKVASYKRKNNHYESLIQSLYHEIDIKNQIITIAQQQHQPNNSASSYSNNTKTNNDNITSASIAYDTELHRSLNIATELSIKNVEQQIQIDQLNDSINKLQKKQLVVDEVTNKSKHPTNSIVTSNRSSNGSSNLIKGKDTVLKVSMIPTNTTKNTSLSLSSTNTSNVTQTPTATANSTLCLSPLSSTSSPSKNVQQKRNDTFNKVRSVSIIPNTTSSPQQCTTTTSTTNTRTSSSSSSSSSRKSNSILQMKIPHIDLTVSCGNVSGIHVTTATTKTQTTSSLPTVSSPQSSTSDMNDRIQPTTINDSCVTGDNICNDTSTMEKIDVSSSKVNQRKDICINKERKHDGVTLKLKSKHNNNKADKHTSNDVKLSSSTSQNNKDNNKTNAQIEDGTSLNQVASIVFI